jgi:hypothetical protein
MDKPNPSAPDDGEKNSGLVKRQTFAAATGEIDVIGRNHSDIIFQKRCMLNEVNVRIKLVRTNDAFCLMSAGGMQLKVVVTFASLLIRKFKISSSVNLAHAKPWKAVRPNIHSDEFYVKISPYLLVISAPVTRSYSPVSCRSD